MKENVIKDFIKDFVKQLSSTNEHGIGWTDRRTNLISYKEVLHTFEFITDSTLSINSSKLNGFEISKVPPNE
jgi:hypothetical protein